jgi:putative transposase
VHKTANVLDKLPKSLQGRAKDLLHDVYLAPTRQDALTAYDRFLTNYQLKYPKDVLWFTSGVLHEVIDIGSPG